MVPPTAGDQEWKFDTFSDGGAKGKLSYSNLIVF
jgi:hypothetical protein